MINPLAIDYILKNSVREAELLVRLREETASHPDARFQVPPEHGQLLLAFGRYDITSRWGPAVLSNCLTQGEPDGGRKLRVDRQHAGFGAIEPGTDRGIAGGQ